MAHGKFAPMTSALLARKGEAAPSIVAGQIAPADIRPLTVGFFDPPSKPAAPASAKTKAPAKARKTRIKPKAKPEQTSAKSRRVVLAITQEEFERLGIAAVKRNLTRQELLHEAVAGYIAKTAGEYGNCRCMASGDPCDCS